MKTFTQNEPLTDAELDRLGDFLKSCKSGKAMNLEELDGFFAALIASPEPVMPSEYNREVFGGDLSEVLEFASVEEANEILGLMMRHWNKIAGTLYKGEIHVPLIFEDILASMRLNLGEALLRLVATIPAPAGQGRSIRNVCGVATVN